MIDKEPTAELDLQFSSDDATPIHGRRGASVWRGRRCTGSRRCARTGGRTSRRCCPSGWTARCTSAPARTNARRRTSCVTPTVSLRLGATRSTTRQAVLVLADTYLRLLSGVK
jgi:hypothetical protein